jgi:hypothetical protein
MCRHSAPHDRAHAARRRRGRSRAHCRLCERAAAHALAAARRRRRRQSRVPRRAALVRARRHPTQAAALGAIESGLVPFFFTHRRDTGAPLFGPFVALDEALQRRALDVARYVLEATQGAALVRAIAACFVSSTKPPVCRASARRSTRSRRSAVFCRSSCISILQ